MKRARQIKLNRLDEHSAMHEAEAACCRIVEACSVVTALYALGGLKLNDNASAIVEEASRLMDKIKAAHAKYEQAGLH